MKAWCDLYLDRSTVALHEFVALSHQKTCLDTQVSLGKALALLYLGQLHEADAILGEIVSKEPQNTRARMAQGAVAFLKGDYQKAISIFTANLDELPSKEIFFSWPSHALNNLGWSYMRTGKYQEALSTFSRLRDYHPDHAYTQVFDGLGWACLNLGRKEEAEKAFRQSLNIAPQNPTALAGLSEISTARSKE
jgi:Flp pilus assembly protein TadD